jgi:RNA polymerase sigma-70 factor (ECF subfamily)
MVVVLGRAPEEPTQSLIDHRGGIEDLQEGLEPCGWHFRVMGNFGNDADQALPSEGDTNPGPDPGDDSLRGRKIVKQPAQGGVERHPKNLGHGYLRLSSIKDLCVSGTVNPGRPARVIHAMSEFATLVSPYSMLAALHGDVDLTDEAKTRSRALNQFLAGVELKAFKIAQAALRHEDDALDAVQDAMLQLARAYAHRPAQEWKPLFYRILENRIRDMQRRRTVRGRVMSWLPFRGEEDEEEPDPISQAPSQEPQPVRRLELDEAVGALEKALGELPRRQQQAFLLRTLEGLDVAATAAAMGCSEGSVKTHYFRAVQALRAQLGDLYV